MRKLLLTLMLMTLLVAPSSSAAAQTDITFTSVTVQFWPEYDQPSMLVIVDYAVPAGTSLPVDLTFRIPTDSNLVAVASYSPEGSLLDAPVTDGPKAEGDWQVFTTTLNSMGGRFEYYQPLVFAGDQRSFAFTWDNVYGVDSFKVGFLEPLDASGVNATPKLNLGTQEQGLNFYSSVPVKLAASEQFDLKLEYKKSSDVLVVSPAPVEPAAPLDETASGRVSFSAALPYVVGMVGVLLMIGGVVYFLQAGKNPGSHKSRRRSHAADEDGEGDVYCAQCGTRARGGDRFCRTCGSRIRQSEE